MIKKDTLDVRALLEGTTPGPWSIERTTRTIFTITSAATTLPIADCGETNVRLIAAAPQLAQDNLALQERVVELEVAVARWRAAGEDVVSQAFTSYTRNGKQMSIEADDGERCSIIPCDAYTQIAHLVQDSRTKGAAQ